MVVQTDIIINFTASLISQTVVMYVKTFKTNVIIFIGNVTICLISHRLTFQYQSQSIETENICR